ncbi:MAG: GUN4 domain-containing protein [Limnospira indica BM01]|nr:GUN4 domain-containing protein [Limnospira indica]QNH60273.1 MAG: GUN4 domain-containing protein [Limnospira indica BM01]
MMAKCPVCETEYTPNEVETCSVCGYDLTPYPPVIGGIPSGFLEKEKKRIAAAKRVWQLSQSQVESAQLMVSHLQSQLDETTRKIDGFTTTQSRLESQIEAIASQLQSQNEAIASQSQSRLESQIEAIASQLQSQSSQIEAIASQLQSQNEAIASQSQSRLESQIEAIASQLQSQSSQIEAIASQLQSQNEAIASQLESITEAVADTPIVSYSGFDYSQLNRLLKSGQWKAADEKTAKMMCRVAGKTHDGYLNYDDIKNFPCEDLRIIDGLWVKHSRGRFGFSVQKQIYINCGGKPDGSYPKGDDILERYADQVGWRVGRSWILKSDCTFAAIAPCGHLPFWPWLYEWYQVGHSLKSVGVHLFSRAQTCLL